MDRVNSSTKLDTNVLRHMDKAITAVCERDVPDLPEQEDF